MRAYLARCIILTAIHFTGIVLFFHSFLNLAIFSNEISRAFTGIVIRSLGLGASTAVETWTTRTFIYIDLASFTIKTRLTFTLKIILGRCVVNAYAIVRADITFLTWVDVLVT